jgi:hypothetical protein
MPRQTFGAGIRPVADWKHRSNSRLKNPPASTFVRCFLVWVSPGRRAEIAARPAAQAFEPDAPNRAEGKTGPAAGNVFL